ncbi:hypothetical protein KKH05_03415 [Patescibacteria group bacterium]|nr:hypothetical protein [Patescibacteria group bacterium]
MNEATGQFGAGGSAPDNQGQEKVNPMSPNFMDSAGGPEQSPPPIMPSNPPMGGLPASPPPPPPAPPQMGASPSPVMGGPSPVSPPPPPKEVDIRTMASDQESLVSSGGLGTTATTVKPPTPLDQPVKKIDSAGAPAKSASGNKKALLIGLGIIIFLGAAAAVANFWVLPIFLNGTDVVEPEAVAPEEVVELPQPTPTIQSFVHKSFLKGPTDVEVELMASEVSLVAIKEALTSIAAEAIASEDTLTEFSVTTGDEGRPVIAEDFIRALLPDVTPEISIEEDFTGFLYNDGENVWPGYVFSFRADAEDKDLLKGILSEDIEASSALSNLFLDDPGAAFSDIFKDGSKEGELTSARYLAYENGGSINYGWKGDKFVISTSYTGFKAVSNMIGDSEAPEAPEVPAVEEATP